VTAKAFVLGFIHDAHPAATEFFQDAIVGNRPSGEWRGMLFCTLRQVNQCQGRRQIGRTSWGVMTTVSRFA
jgi:hypothetical protein